MNQTADRENAQQDALRRAKKVKKTYTNMLMTKANVVGVGIGFAQQGQRFTEKIALIVLVSQKLPHSMLTKEDIIPREIEGVPVDVQEVGTIRAQKV